MSDQAGQKLHIALAIHQGFSMRYLLQTDILPTLLEDAHVSILTQEDPASIQQVCDTTDIEFCEISTDRSAAYFQSSRIQRYLAFIRLCTLGKAISTAEIWWERARADARINGAGFRTTLIHGILRCFIRIARRSRTVRRSMLALEARQYTPTFHVDALKRLNPDLVVTTSLGTFDYDQYVMRAAHKLGIPVAAVILSWDNTTTRGYPGAAIDHVIAWTETMKRELIDLHDISEEKVFVGGIAHFDKYYQSASAYDRTDFFRKNNLDPNKRLIVFATKSPNAYPYNPNIVEALADACEDGRLPEDVQILVRVHPLHFKFKQGEPVYAELLDLYRTLDERHDCLCFNMPKIGSDKIDYVMEKNEIGFLSDLLRSADVLVNIFSTLNIEGAIFDIPLVNICFEGERPMYDFTKKSRFGISSDFREDHNQRIARSGGTQIVYNQQDMVTAVDNYLLNQKQDRSGREKIRQSETGANGGNAGIMIGHDLIAFAQNSVSKVRLPGQPPIAAERIARQ